jgi:hypothetical protein
VSFLLGDYNRLFATAVWLFFASGLLMLKRPGNGVAYLGPGRVRVRFPSWRAAFGRRLALVVYPIHSFWPMAEVVLHAASRCGAMEELAASAQQLERPMRLARPFLLALTLMVAVLIPSGSYTEVPTLFSSLWAYWRICSMQLGWSLCCARV